MIFKQIGLVFGLFLLSTSFSHAGQSLIGVYPTTMKVRVPSNKHKEPVKIPLKLTNLTNFKAKVDVLLLEYHKNKDNTLNLAKMKANEPSPYTAIPNIKLSSPSLVLKPKEVRTIDVIISPSENSIGTRFFQYKVAYKIIDPNRKSNLVGIKVQRVGLGAITYEKDAKYQVKQEAKVKVKKGLLTIDNKVFNKGNTMLFNINSKARILDDKNQFVGNINLFKKDNYKHLGRDSYMEFVGRLKHKSIKKNKKYKVILTTRDKGNYLIDSVVVNN